MKLTARNTAGLKTPPGKQDHIEFDDDIPGFGLRMREGGSRVWIFQYRIGTKQRRIVLGKATALAPDKARDLASNLHAKVRLGGDPAADKVIGRAQAANSFGDLARRYLEFQQDNLRPRSLVEVKRHLEDHAKPLHGLPVATVDQRTIADRLNLIAKAAGAVTANRVRASLSALFGWAMREGLASANPVMNTNKREEKSRDRVLSDQELRIIWNALEDDHYGAIVKLLMLTGQRANEIAGLRYPEINFDKNVISLPGERTKNGRPHDVPMSGTVHAILEAQAKTDGRACVFGYGDGPFSGWSKSKERLETRIADANGEPLPHWVPHDLRRTVATRMADLGVQPHVIEAVLNHVSGHKGGIAGIYNRAVYAAEKAQALTLWADHVSALVAGRESNVTPLKRA